MLKFYYIFEILYFLFSLRTYWMDLVPVCPHAPNWLHRLSSRSPAPSKSWYKLMINWHVWTDAFDIANQHSVSAAHSFGCHHSNTPGPNRFDSCPVLSVQIEPDLEHMCSTSEAPNGIDIHVLHTGYNDVHFFFSFFSLQIHLSLADDSKLIRLWYGPSKDLPSDTEYRKYSTGWTSRPRLNTFLHIISYIEKKEKWNAEKSLNKVYVACDPTYF